MEVISDDASNQESEMVATIKTPAKQKTLLTDSSAAAAAISKLENSPPPKVQKVAQTEESAAPEPTEDIKTPGPGGATGDVSEAQAGDDLTDIMPDAAATTVPTPVNLKWDRSVHWRSRVQKAVSEYSDNPAALRQILSQETPNVAKHIRSELARAGKTVE